MSLKRRLVPAALIVATATVFPASAASATTVRPTEDKVTGYSAQLNLDGSGVLHVKETVQVTADGDTIYATCVSTVYAHAQTYNGQLWRPLPARPAPSYPTRDGGEWRAFAPDITLPPQSSPLVWPPTTTWIQANAVDDLMQLDPGDGKLFQVGSVRGDFFAVNGVDEELSAEYFYMKPAYAEAGHTDTATRIVDANSQAFLANWWSSIGSDWDVGDQMAINGCVNYKGDGLPSPL